MFARNTHVQGVATVDDAVCAQSVERVELFLYRWTCCTRDIGRRECVPWRYPPLPLRVSPPCKESRHWTDVAASRGTRDSSAPTRRHGRTGQRGLNAAGIRCGFFVVVWCVEFVPNNNLRRKSQWRRRAAFSPAAHTTVCSAHTPTCVTTAGTLGAEGDQRVFRVRRSLARNVYHHLRSVRRLQFPDHGCCEVCRVSDGTPSDSVDPSHDDCRFHGRRWTRGVNDSRPCLPITAKSPSVSLSTTLGFNQISSQRATQVANRCA